MAVHERVDAGVRNAFLRRPVVDADEIERVLRRANRRFGRGLGRIEWVGSLEAYIRRSAELMLDGWTVAEEGPLSPPERFWWGVDGRVVRRLDLLNAIERQFWVGERAAHSTARLSRSRRLPVYLNAIEAPDLAADAADSALEAEATAAVRPARREHGFAADKYWKSEDPHWVQARAKANVPFLTEVARAFGAGLFAGALLRRGTAARTLLIARPRLRLGSGTLHAADEPAVVWPDGSERWYWDGIAVPDAIVKARHGLTAELVARLDNQELRRVVLDQIGWERFLATADAELRAQDDFGKLWTTTIRLDGERTHLVEVVNATAEPDGSYRRYFLRVPPTITTARQGVAWTFGFATADDYIVAAAS